MSRRTPAEVRWSKFVAKTDGCWHWLGAKQPDGYGRFRNDDGAAVLAHRWAYESARGPIPSDMTVDHLCRNTSCVNPAHMEIVSREVNASRGSRNGAKSHCDHGHEFTPENTYSPPSRPSVRDCRTCRQLAREAYRARHNGVAA